MTPGSVAWLARALFDWAVTVRQGMALVTYRSASARDAVVHQLRESFKQHSWRAESLVCSECSPREFLERIGEAAVEVLFVLDPDRVLFTEDDNHSTAWVNFHREAITGHPGVQIWWMPPNAAIRFSTDLPDLNRFFLFREELLDMGPEPESHQPEYQPVHSEEVRLSPARGRDLLQRALHAANSGATQARVWSSLGIPAILALLNGGRMPEALAGFGQLCDLAGEPELALDAAANELTAAELAESFRDLGRLRRRLSGYSSNEVRNLQLAVEDCRNALQFFTRESSLLEWAGLQRELGNAFYGLYWSGNAGFEEAIECYERAATVLTRSDHPRDWALIQNNLGSLSATRAEAGDREYFERARDYYYRALTVLTEASDPEEWAIVQDNLGVLYRSRAERTNLGDLQRSIECHRAALRVRRESRYPLEWAKTMRNLGRTYLDLGQSSPRAPLDAIYCFTDALRVFTKEAFPADWAVIQMALGDAYRELRGPDRPTHLRRAIQCYEEALSVFTSESFPNQHRDASARLARARDELQQLEQPPKSTATP